MSTSARGLTRFVDPDVLARIDDLELIARTVVEGVTNGIHKSPFLGLSLDFAEHRAYMPGDDIRRIDWRLFARTDRHYVKQFEADTNANTVLLLDVSRSMEYSTRLITKLDYARYLTACLAYFSKKQGDRIGLVTFDTKIVERIPPSARHLDLVLHAIERAEPRGAGGIAAPLRALAEHLKRRSVVVLISDLYEEPEAIGSALGSMAAAGHDIIVFHILDPAEVDFPFDSATNFQDLESGEKMAVIPEDLVDEYRAVVQEHTRRLSKLLSERRVDYRLFNTATPLDYALFDYLSARERWTRTR
jgi:uncharacterized protein (DUF58 family)